MMRIEQVRLLRLQDIQLKTGKQIGLACEEENRGGDCPKTQKSILKVEGNDRFFSVNKNKVVLGDDFVVYIDAKVDNCDQLKLVFGQSEGDRWNGF